jgi:hypothetical protein
VAFRQDWNPVSIGTDGQEKGSEKGCVSVSLHRFCALLDRMEMKEAAN